jgi:hypothetical protein
MALWLEEPDPEAFPTASRGGTTKTRTTNMKSALAVLAFAALIIPAQAEKKKDGDAPKGKGDPAKVFKKKDTDNDGFLTSAEFTEGAKDPAKAAKAFKRKDKDGDEKLSLEEFKPSPPKGKGKGKKKKDTE